MCGITGACTTQGDAVALAYGGLVSLQHRGQESWGIAVARAGRIEALRALGVISGSAGSGNAGSNRSVIDAARLAVGHTRYSTTGAPRLENSQPLVAESRDRAIAVVHNGDISNATELRTSLSSRGYVFRSTSDSEVILALLTSARTVVPDGIEDAMARLEGAYSVVVLVGETLAAFRDPHGFRPLMMGVHRGGSPAGDPGEDAAVDSPGGAGMTTVFASESCALDLLDCEEQREIAPGELVVASPRRAPRSYQVAPEGKRHFCVFEYIYLARPDSRFGDVRVGRLRQQLGERLGQESPVEADAVVPVPASGVPAALGYARATGLPVLNALVRNEYVGRTFIEPDTRLRNLHLKLKFNVGETVSGRRLVVVDDSVVRGSTMRSIVKLLRRFGARDVHVRIASPPLISGCFYGVDIAGPEQLVAAGRTTSEIGRALGATSLAYLSPEGLDSALRVTSGNGLCKGCLTGFHPTPVPRERNKLRLA